MKALPLHLFLAAALLVPACRRAADSGMAVMTVHAAPFVETIPARGELQAVRSTNLQPPPIVRGRQTIAWIVAENSLVRKGQPVIRMDDTWFREQIAVEEFNLAKMDLQIRQMEKQAAKEKSDLQQQVALTEIEKQMADVYAARDTTIFPRNKIIEDAVNLDFLQTKSRYYDQKQAKLERKNRAEIQLLQLKKRTSQVKLEQLQKALGSLVITAPHDGLLVYERSWRGEKPKVGMNVFPGMVLAKLPDLHSMEAVVYVLEAEAAGLAVNLPVTLRLDAVPQREYRGRVGRAAKVANPLDGESPLKYFEVRVELAETDPAVMKPGSQVRAHIEVKRIARAISVPHQALVMADGVPYVLVRGTGGVTRRRVQTGERSLTRTVIRSGLQEGERILLGDPGREQER